MGDRFILLVEDDPDDEALTIGSFEKSHLGNEIIVAHDGGDHSEGSTWRLS